ncbi:hypothetical protein OUZ56_010601 [Daphnia magna]|uniref:Uncharacterized protein n=1 Tax=Daphnia magna TaxID=35525 RepID=A0ABR0AIZ8_9CRUS|nr:hypothetical protein OUZ56_010601 [Daphnia magna]
MSIWSEEIVKIRQAAGETNERILFESRPLGERKKCVCFLFCCCVVFFGQSSVYCPTQHDTFWQEVARTQC